MMETQIAKGETVFIFINRFKCYWSQIKRMFLSELQSWPLAWLKMIASVKHPQNFPEPTKVGASPKISIMLQMQRNKNNTIRVA